MRVSTNNQKIRRKRGASVAPQKSGKATHQGIVLRRRVTALFLFCFLLATAILVRAAQVQILGDERLANLAKRQFNSTMVIRPHRGMIFDRNGEALAINVKSKSLAANPTKIENKYWVAKKLAKLTGKSRKKILKKLKSSREFVWIQRHLSESALKRLRKLKLMNSQKKLISGLWLVKENKRAYPFGASSGQLLGSVNIDTEGLEGLELSLNKELKGKGISYKTIRDALGRKTYIDATVSSGLKNGGNVKLTIDAPLQFSVEQSLRESIEKTGAESGTIIVMNAVNGEVLTMANYPTYNPNNRKTPGASRRNRAITDGYEPGSTIKPVLVASAYLHEMTDGEAIWAEEGKYKVEGAVITEAESKTKHGWLTLDEIIKFSSNIGAAKVALKIGKDDYLDTLKIFGIGEKTGIQFPGEISGWVPQSSKTSPLVLATIGFGQGLFVTPIQIVRAIATFMNGGYLVEPRLVREIDQELTPIRKHKVIPKLIADKILAALSKTSDEGGTAVLAKVDGYRIAGKTGTAQLVDPKTKKYSKTDYIASFVGSLLDVDPNLIVFVKLDKPKGFYYASQVAAPLAKNVFELLIRRYGIPKSDGTGLVAESEVKVPEKFKKINTMIGDRLYYSAAHPNQELDHSPHFKPLTALIDTGQEKSGKSIWKLPSLKGLSASEVMKVFEGHQFDFRFRGFGVVSQQYPEAGSLVQEGSRIRVFSDSKSLEV